MSNLQQEWAIIHQDIEKYEKYSLLIKLFSILISIIAIAYHIHVVLALIFIFILWLQDGIWTTFQGRMQTRILVIEKGLRQQPDNTDQAYQLYTQWHEQSKGGLAVIVEYIKNSLKPTVSYPYIVLIGLMLLTFQFIH